MEEQLIEEFIRAVQSDDEPWDKKGERLIRTYQSADDKGKALIDDLFITLCGWSLETLIEKVKGT